MAETKAGDKGGVPDGNVRRSISIRLIRHAESRNNEVYREGRKLFHGGTSEYNHEGWLKYVNQHRKADPSLSQKGREQCEVLADFLVPQLRTLSSRPIRIITSPMRRALETIAPTIERLLTEDDNEVEEDATTDPDGPDSEKRPMCDLLVQGFYHETEGCHLRGIPESGMNREEIRKVLLPASASKSSRLDFVGFPQDPSQGWWQQGAGAETRSDAEARAAKFYLWFCEHLDHQLEAPDVVDAGVSTSSSTRRRAVVLLGHGDFMSSVLKRMVSGFGHTVENEGVPHRAAFVHYNTGITELEYFGAGRFLIMGVNQIPHLPETLKSGGTLKDGWSFIMPPDDVILEPDAEVAVAFADEVEPHIKEQTMAMRSLYLDNGATAKETNDNSSAATTGKPRLRRMSSLKLTVEAEAVNGDVDSDAHENGAQKSTTSSFSPSSTKDREVHFSVKRGLEVVAYATYQEETGLMSDVVVRTSARREEIAKTLVHAVKAHAAKLGTQRRVHVEPATLESQSLLEALGFSFVDGVGEEVEENGGV